MVVIMSYKEIGLIIKASREAAGIDNQLELAKRMNVTQQTISRYEKGSVRPTKPNLIKISNILNIDLNELLLLANHDIQKSEEVATCSKAFPVDALSPYEFEKFYLLFLSYVYPNCKVHLAGGQGHTQDGIDLDVVFPDGNVFTYQCKNEKQFGPQKVADVVNAHNRNAKEKHLLLSRIASPQAREEIRKYKGWDIWDKEDISLKIRNLPKVEQKKIVSTYFRGQELALLGEDDLSPLQTPEDAYSHFNNKKAIFNHAWDLIGRGDDLNNIKDSLDDIYPITIITGPGGIGKTRLLKETVSTGTKFNKIWILSETEIVTKKDLLDMKGVTNEDILLVIDDAHERDDLELIFNYVAQTKKIKLLISTRSYGLSKLTNQINRFISVIDSKNIIKVKILSESDSVSLAEQVLISKGGDISLAKRIATLTMDCPLATVIGAFIVSEKDISLDMLSNEDKFRDLLFSRFAKVISGNLSESISKDTVNKVLTIISLTQPFDFENKSIPELLYKLEGVSETDFNKTISLLRDGGLLFKRGRQYRLSPDMLADYIIEGSCVGHDKEPIGYAEKVFEYSSGDLLANILTNLGKLDWRLSSGDTANSKLLSNVWNKVNDLNADNGLSNIGAVKSVAFYQPERALDFVEKCIRENQFKRSLPEIIKYAAYNFDCLKQACDCLWELGHKDKNNDKKNKQHAIIELSSIATVVPNKPLGYVEFVVNFALSLLDFDSSFKRDNTPFNILKGFMKTHGRTSTSEGLVVTSHGFTVNKSAVEKIRKRVIDKTMNLLMSKDANKSIFAALFIRECLDAPYQNKDLGWNEEFLETLSEININIKSGLINDLAVIELLRSIGGVFCNRNKELISIRNEIYSNLPENIDFRVKLSLVDGYNYIFDKDDRDINKWEKIIRPLSIELKLKYPRAQDLFNYTSALLIEIDSIEIIKSYYPDPLFEVLLENNKELCLLVIDFSLKNQSSITSRLVSYSLYELFKISNDVAREQVNRIIHIGNYFLKTEVSRSLPRVFSSHGLVEDNEIRTIELLLKETDEDLLTSTVNSINRLASIDSNKAINLMTKVDLSKSNKVCDEVLSIIRKNHISISNLSEYQVDMLLNNMVSLYDLDGYWIDHFMVNLADHYPNSLIKFLIRRIEKSVELNDWSYRVVNKIHRDNQKIVFGELANIKDFISDIFNWIVAFPNKTSVFKNNTAKVFNYLFAPFGRSVVAEFENSMFSNSHSCLETITLILSKADPDFVFDYEEFVVKYLNAIQDIDREAYLSAIDTLCSATIYNENATTRTVGEPAEKDVHILERAKLSRENVGKFSSAFNLYDKIISIKKSEIERAAKMDEYLY